MKRTIGPEQLRTGRGRIASLATGIVLSALAIAWFPSAGVAGIVTSTLNPTADAYVDLAAPTTNFGTAPDLFAGSLPTRRSYVKFTVPPLAGTVSKATLKLYPTASSTTGFAVRTASNSWTETAITYLTSPSPSNAITVSSGALTAGQWTDLDVTPRVRSNSTLTLALTSTASPAVALASRESSNKPQLVIDVNDTNAPTVTLTAPAAGASMTTHLPIFRGRAGNAVGDTNLVTVKVYAGTSATGTPVQTLTATRQSNNNYSVTASAPLDFGTYTARAEQQDTAGNTGFSSANTFKISETVVSLTFDDGTANQYAARSMLSSRGMRGTFFLNSSVIGNNVHYLTWTQVNELITDGNEIGGHTTNHAHLTQSDPDEAKRQICYDRNTLLEHGIAARSFAYPFGEFDASTEAMVSSCGYNSGRGVDSFEGMCPPACAEKIPPPNPYATLTVGYGPDGLTTLKNKVTAAERNGGGWVQIVIHGICTNCGVNGMTAATLTAFLDWLKPRAAIGTVVKTVHEVVGGPVHPAVAGPPLPPAPQGTNVIRNASLEQDADADGLPDCYRRNSWGSHTSTWTRTTDAHSGSWAEQVDVSGYTDGADLVQTWDDLGFCTPTVTPGHQYTLTTWYKSTGPVRFTTNTRDSFFSSPFLWWTESPEFPASSTWQQASWTTPPIPAGTSGLIFGLMITGNGSLTVDDVGIVDANPTE